MTHLVFVLALLFGASAWSAGQNEYADRMRTGSAETAKGNFSAAMVKLQSAIKADPSNASGWYELGVLYGQIGDFRSAEEGFRHALQLAPELAKAHYMLGLSLIANPQSKLDWPAAIAEFRSALKIQPDYPEASSYLGVGLTATGQTDLAISELEHATRLAPSLSSAHFNLAIALESDNRLAEAVKEYREAIASKGEYPEASSALGKLLFRMGEGLDADKELRNALRLNPDLQDAHYALGRVLQSLKRTSEAKIEFEEAVALGQRQPDAIESSQLSNLSLQTASKGDLAGAETLLRKAIVLRPDYGIPHYNLGLILADRGDLDGAASQLIQAISLLPGQAKPWFDLARVQNLQGNYEEALKSLLWAARLAPSNTKIQTELKKMDSAATGYAAGSTDSIAAAQPRLGAISDTSADHFAFANELNVQKDWLGAVGELLRSLALSPAAVGIRANLAENYLRLGDADRAMLEEHKVLLVAPDNLDAHLGLGTILLAKDRPNEAAEEFRKALTYSPNSKEGRSGLEEALRRSEFNQK